jgi:hypothetical protein
MKEKCFICKNCGRKYNFEGWERGKELEMGNNYHYDNKGKYCICGCGNKVYL